MKHIYYITPPAVCPTATEDEDEDEKNEETEGTAQGIDPDNPEPLVLLEFD